MVPEEKIEIEQLCSRIVAYEGEPRIRDLDVARTLEYTRHNNVRNLIKGNVSVFEQHGSLLCREVTPSTGGPVASEYWLNEKQVYALCQLSDAPKAGEIRRLMVEVFYAYQHKTNLASKRGLQ